jgi:hypothetical protein
MRLRKVAQTIAQSIFCENQNINFTVEKSSPIICATSVIFTKLPKVNSHPIGENSPNHVTLVDTKTFEIAVAREGMLPRRHIQVCQIILYLLYQNGGKYTKLPLNYQMAIKYTK